MVTVKLLGIMESDAMVGIVEDCKDREVYFVNLDNEPDGEDYEEEYPAVGDTFEISEWYLSVPRRELTKAMRHVRDEGRRTEPIKKAMKLKAGQKQCKGCGAVWGARKQECDCGWSFEGRPKEVDKIKSVLIDFYGETLEEDGTADKMAFAIHKRIKE